MPSPVFRWCCLPTVTSSTRARARLLTGGTTSPAFWEGATCKPAVASILSDRLAPGLWAYARPPSEREWRAVKVFRLKLDEVSAKVASGLPEEDEADYATDLWAGHVPLTLTQGAPVPDAKLKAGIDAPDFVTAFRYAGLR